MTVKYMAVPVYMLIPVSEHLLAKGEHFDHIAAELESAQRMSHKRIVCPAPGELGDWEFGTMQELEEMLEGAVEVYPYREEATR